MSDREGWRKNAISIRVEGMPGSHIADIGEDMLALSQRLGVGVSATINGVEMQAWPHYAIEDVRRVYDAGIALSSPHTKEEKL